MKKLLSVILIIALLCSMLTLGVSAASSSKRVGWSKEVSYTWREGYDTYYMMVYANRTIALGVSYVTQMKFETLKIEGNGQTTAKAYVTEKRTGRLNQPLLPQVTIDGFMKAESNLQKYDAATKFNALHSSWTASNVDFESWQDKYKEKFYNAAKEEIKISNCVLGLMFGDSIIYTLENEFDYNKKWAEKVTGTIEEVVNDIGNCWDLFFSEFQSTRGQANNVLGAAFDFYSVINQCANVSATYVPSAMGEKAKIKIDANDDKLQYSWKVKNEGKSKYGTSSITKSTYSVTMSNTSKNRKVYCVIKAKSSGESVTVGPFCLMPVGLKNQPASTVVAKDGETAYVQLHAVGAGKLKYTWYIKAPGAKKFSKSSNKGSCYSCRMSDKSRGRVVYCVVTDENGNKMKSKEFTLQMALKIKSQPMSTTAKKGSTIKVRVKAIGDGLKYTWYVKNPNSSKYVKSSITKSTYSVKMTSKINGRYVYCVVKDKYGNWFETRKVRLVQR